ncbi:LuxR C-terminal-related transcriptional regulator [Pseudomonas kuykendallii]|uniref:Helix-turn-helix transcriptional regulator n=1 Tax=Pseudomonas kuykendallii TaxID=1007099 RepID=A0A2W5CVS3_9PSED|nr:LuxR C-terminal-related transcriptional regulator [Pseudomonas kuykendallii]PZP23735.1 MAG: helix-turn-helix transcriptional regulator [Pseudomonas kuykendallii]
MLTRAIRDSLPVAPKAPALPRLPPLHLPRTRLTRPLLASECRLRLLCAPAGFGKSVLLNECARHLPRDTRLVWLDLAGRALSPAALLERLSTALADAASDGPVLEALLELLHRQAQPLWLVLDDYPREGSAELDGCLEQLFERGPASLCWWISSRRRPAWNLPRLQLQGDLLMFGAQALALTREELRQLLDLQAPTLGAQSLERLYDASEGWLAGVRLLLLDADEQALAQRLVNGTALLRDYIVQDVLADLEDELREALFALALLPRFCAELCEHVLDGGAERLAVLLQRQLFIRTLDSCGDWFRLWRPLALVLRRLPSPVLPTSVHVRACQWFAGNGDIREAVEQALLAGQMEVAANYLQRFGQEQLLIGQNVSLFLQWRNELPHTLFSSTGRLIVLQAWALMICARLDEVEACLADLAHFLPQPDARRQRELLAHWQAISGALARQRGQPQARQWCLEALAELPERAWSPRVLCYQILSQQALAEGNLDEGEHYGDEGIKLARLHASVLYEGLLTVDRVHLLEMRGETDRALELLEQALDALGDTPTGPVPARLWLLRGHLLAVQGLAGPAREAFQVGLDAALGSGDAYTFFGYLGLAELAAYTGQHPEAFRWLAEAERLMQWRHVPAIRYRCVLQLGFSVLWLQQGEVGKARAALEPVLQHYQDNGLLAPPGAYDVVIHVRHQLALCELLDGSPRRAVEDLSALLDECLRNDLQNLACECRCSLAEALLAAGQAEAAEEELRRAIGMAVRQRRVRPLLALQQRQAHWLGRLLPGASAQPLHERLLNPLERDAEAPVADAALLSQRELTVLKLIAQGCSNQDIAQQLYISLHTVKTHARRINVKLGVRRRTQAVATAKALGLIG